MVISRRGAQHPHRTACLFDVVGVIVTIVVAVPFGHKEVSAWRYFKLICQTVVVGG